MSSSYKAGTITSSGTGSSDQNPEKTPLLGSSSTPVSYSPSVNMTTTTGLAASPAAEPLLSNANVGNVPSSSQGKSTPTAISKRASFTSQQQQQSTSYNNAQQQLPQTAPTAAAAAAAAAANAAATTKQQQQQNKRVVTKISRPRKAIAEFRKQKGGRGGRTVWQGRIGVHVKVDEIHIEQLSKSIETNLKGWAVTDYYDAIRLYQTEPPYVGHEQWVDWPMSENEDDDADGVYRGGRAQGEVDWNAAMPEIFIFSFGVVVFWNFPSADFEDKWITENLMKPNPDCFGDPLTETEIEAARDEMTFVFGGRDQPETTFKLKRDMATLTTRETGEKLAVSFASAKSSLLTVYEERVQRTIQRNSHIPEELAKNGQLHMSRQDISKEVGRMLIVKHGINLDQSLIDTPEEFWEDDRFEGTYDAALKYFEISKRLTLVNNRLNMIGELHQVLIEANQNHHAVILEWIVIILIVVEVLLDMMHLGFY